MSVNDSTWWTTFAFIFGLFSVVEIAGHAVPTAQVLGVRNHDLVGLARVSGTSSPSTAEPGELLIMSFEILVHPGDSTSLTGLVVSPNILPIIIRDTHLKNNDY